VIVRDRKLPNPCSSRGLPRLKYGRKKKLYC
jgi:hypothetical protein